MPFTNEYSRNTLPIPKIAVEAINDDFATTFGKCFIECVYLKRKCSKNALLQCLLPVPIMNLASSGYEKGLIPSSSIKKASSFFIMIKPPKS